ncbi:MAG: putative transmembrane anti-sigma factor [Planctomycetota bacterium]|nr:MAG: putative transmembrane anti-sigma factor [Planctomycetota bacterium]
MSLPADDLLSAFHDGELNSAERAAVEQRLATSAETRRELSEIRQVSSLLKELPREQLPAEFPQQVLQAIEREMLIPSRPSDSLSAPTSESIGGTGWSRRWVGAAAVLTSAAGLLLLVRMVDHPTGRSSSDNRQLAESTISRTAPADGALDASMSGRDAPGGFGDRPPPMMTDATSSMSRRSGQADRGVDSSAVAKNLPSSDTLQSLGLATRESESLVVDRSGLRDATIGDVVRAMQTDGNEVAVVWLTVVDRQAGLAGLQFLLASNHIAREDAVEKADKRKAEQPESNAGQMHAVFVESDPEQLTATLKQLRNKDFWQSMEVDQPIELAQLDEVRHGRLPVAEKLNDGASEDRTVAKADATKELSGPSSAKRRAAVPSPTTAEKKIANVDSAPKSAADPEAKGILDVKGSLAKQVTFDVPLEALVQNQSLNQLNQQSRNRGMPRSSFQKQTVAGQRAGVALADQRPMQVLFVVVDQLQAGKPQTSPSNSPKPAAAPAKTRTEPAKPAGQDGAA